MKKVLWMLALAWMLAVPAGAQAQAPLSFDVVQVQFLPEYDQPNMLVIVDFKVAAAATLPAQINMRVPADANIHAVAMESPDGLLFADYADPVPQGEWMSIAITVSSNVLHRVEYYVPLSKTGTEREFTYIWTGDYAVNQFQVTLQEASDSSNVIVTPDLPSVQPDSSGLIYHQGAFSSLEAGQEFPITVKYSRSTDALTVSSLQVEPAGSVDNTASGSLSNALPITLAGAGALLIGGGIFWYWKSEQASAPKSRKRHTRRAEAEDDDDSGDTIYCSQCGKRAQPGDRFCRTCGTKIDHRAG
jgi:hypothetical protein